MPNKRAKTKKPKQKKANSSAGNKGGSMEFADIGSPQPKKKKKQK